MLLEDPHFNEPLSAAMQNDLVAVPAEASLSQPTDGLYRAHLAPLRARPVLRISQRRALRDFAPGNSTSYYRGEASRRLRLQTREHNRSIASPGPEPARAQQPVKKRPAACLRGPIDGVIS